MSRIKFWKSWDTDLKYPYLFLLVLAVAALLLAGYSYVAGTSATYAWDKITDLQLVQMPVQEVTRLLEPFTLYADGYLVLEQYDVALPAIQTFPAAVFITILGVCIAFYTAAISTMKQLPYFAGVLLLMLFLATFNFDLLQVLGDEGGQTMLLLVIAVLAGASYAFQAFWQHVRFGWRVLVMLALVFLLGFATFMEAEFTPALTALHLVSYSSLGTLIVALLFMIWVSYENVNALLWINTQGKTPERRYSLWQFVLIGGLYLLNLLLLYLRHIGYFTADLIYVNAYVLLLLSVVAGFWGMRQREAFYGKIFPFKPTGAVLYLVFATITFLSIGYAFTTSNDSFTALYRDLIVYTHLVYGGMFFIYVLLNFGVLIRERKAVYKVVYEPQTLTLFSFFFISTLILGILVVRTQYRHYFYAKAGYYNNIGDLYRASGNTMLAQRFYEESDVFDLNNVKANYSLAAMSRELSQHNSEITFMKAAVARRPDPKLYVRLANLYDGKQYFFEKLYVLHEGIKKFPESGELYNNMALLYMQTSVTDSTEYYFDLAEKFAGNKEAIRSNRLAFYTRQAMLEPARDLLGRSSKDKYVALRSNMAALRQLLGTDAPQKEDAFIPDSLQQAEDFTLFYNQTIRRLGDGDTSRLQTIDRYLKVRGNQLFQEDLLYAKGLVHHYSGRPKEARSIVENLALAASERSGYYYNALGIWMLEEENYAAAAHYFKQAKDLGYRQAYLSHGYALAMAHQPEAAVNALQEVGFTELESATAAANQLQTVLQHTPQTIVAAPDADKVKFLQVYLPRLTAAQVNTIVNSIQEKDLSRVAMLARIDHLMQQKQWRAANDAIKEAGTKLQPEGEQRSKLNLQQLKLWLYTRNYDALVNRMDNLHLTERDKRYKLYFAAAIADAKGREREAAEKYAQAVKMLLYDEEVVTAAARFFKEQNPDEMTAYNILLDGITYNPFSVELHKSYALESINKGLASYANQALETLQRLLPASEYSTFIQKFERQRQEAEAKADNWQL